MSIKTAGGVFGRNPTFNDVTVDGDLSISGTLSIGGETITGLSYQGGWNADTNTPDIAASSPVTGQFWIVSADGSTDVGGITNWTSGDWALYDGTNWQRVEGGNTDLTTGVSGQLAVANGGTGAADAATARTNLGLGTAATTAATDYATAAQGTTADSALQPADIGVSVQGYDADIAKYDDTTANFTGTLQNGGSNVVVDTDIGSTVQAYDADTAKLDTAQSWSANQTFGDNIQLQLGDKPDLLIYHDGSNSIVEDNGAGSLVLKTAANGAVQIKNSEDDVLAYFQGNNESRLYYNNIQTLTTKSGGVEVTSGNLIIANSGNGIDFSATSGTGTSELLDDYEEGTWTPDPQDSSGNSASTGNNDGTYIKIGRLCLVTYNINNINTTGLTSGDDFRVYGLPYTPASLPNNQHWTGAVNLGQTTFTGSVVSDLFDAGTYFRFREVISGSGGDYIIVSELTSGTCDFFGSFTYYTA